MHEDRVEEDQGDDGDSEEEEYDMEYFDDDGRQLIDDDGEGLIPFDDQQEYDENEAVALMSFAGTYREVHGRLQATRVGRDQKYFGKKGSSKKGFGKSKGKGRDRRKFWTGNPRNVFRQAVRRCSRTRLVENHRVELLPI